MTRLSYVLTTTILATGFLLAVHLHDLNRQLDREMLEQMDELARLLEEAEQQNIRLRDERRGLREGVEEANRLRYVRAKQRQALSRSGRPSIPILSASGMMADHFERAFRELGKPGMAGLGQAFEGAEAATGVSALVLAGICALESGWGESKLARERNNLAGLGAYDGREDECGLAFGSRSKCVMALAELIADGGTLDDVGRWYASDPGWARKVVGCMRMIGEVNVGE